MTTPEDVSRVRAILTLSVERWLAKGRMLKVGNVHETVNATLCASPLGTLHEERALLPKRRYREALGLESMDDARAIEWGFSGSPAIAPDTENPMGKVEIYGGRKSPWYKLGEELRSRYKNCVL